MQLPLTFTRTINILYLLKKMNYYCFIHKSSSGSLTILNGGSIKKLAYTDINYYFNNMDKMIKEIQKPLKKYTAIQEKISNSIKKIGGSGKIHGAIVDIDFFNHIFVNPLDLIITPYWASDIINKLIYPSVPALLQEQSPLLFENYQKLLEVKNDDFFMKKESTELMIKPIDYYDTDIYNLSGKIKKMQKLKFGILSYWREDE
jgi:hypothetical protein